MLNKYDFKNIIKRVIVALAVAFILFNINKCNAKASVVMKQQGSVSWSNNSQNGYFLGNTNQVGTGVPQTGSTAVGFNLTSNFTPNTDYDYIGFRLTQFLTVEFNGVNNFCSNYSYTYDSNGHITNMYCNVSPTNANSTILSDTLQISPILNTTDGYYNCFFSKD